MKRIIVVLLLASLIFIQSCKKSGADGETTLPPPSGQTYGDGWAYAPMDRQIMADDGDFAVTGSGFVYKDGWLGVAEDGFFDLACLYEPGSGESFTFCFDYYAKDGCALYAGLWLYGVDCTPGDGTDGVWMSFSDGSAVIEGEEFKIKKGAVSVRIEMDSAEEKLTVFADGVKITERECPPKNGGGAVKAVSAKGPVYISNAAFRIGI